MTGQSPEGDSGHRSLTDSRGAALGLGRLIYILFWVAGGLIVIVAIWKLLSEPEQPVGARLVSLLAGLVYLAAAAGLTHNGRRMRILAWSAIAVAIAGPIIVGLLEEGEPYDASVWSPWANFGSQVWYASLVLPIVGLVWLWWTNPRRIVELSEGLERRRRTVEGE